MEDEETKSETSAIPFITNKFCKFEQVLERFQWRFVVIAASPLMSDFICSSITLWLHVQLWFSRCKLTFVNAQADTRTMNLRVPANFSEALKFFPLFTTIEETLRTTWSRFNRWRIYLIAADIWDKGWMEDKQVSFMTYGNIAFF